MKKLFLVLLVIVLSHLTFAQNETIKMVSDMELQTKNGGFGNPILFNGNVYFTADDGVHGNELWEYNGSSLPTMLMDIRPGSGFGTYFSPRIIFNGKLYFFANDGVNGQELWEYDGINAPSMVLDVNTSTYNSKILFIYNNKLYFDADVATGSSLWEYDGINLPIMVSNFNIGSGALISAIYDAIEFNGRIILGIAESNGNRELWEYDGVNSPIMISDNNPFAHSTFVNRFIIFNNTLIYRYNDSSFGEEIWMYDGVNPPSMLHDINIGSAGSGANTWNDGLYFKEFNNKLVFAANDGINGNEIWEYDGVSAPYLLADINIGAGNSNPLGFTEYNSKLYFQVSDENNEPHLWEYDGVNPPLPSQDTMLSKATTNLANCIIFNSNLLFSGNIALYGNEITSYDGVVPPTNISNINPSGLGSSPSGLTNFKNELYFFTSLVNIDSYCINKIDSVNGEPILIFCDTSSNRINTNVSPIVYNNLIYFVLYSGPQKEELWSYDGLNTPVKVMDINDHITFFVPNLMNELHVFNNKLYFGGNLGVQVNKREIWEFDGINPPISIGNLDSSALSSSNYNINAAIFFEFNNELYFRKMDNQNDLELWRYDGVTTPTQVSNINLSGSSNVANFIEYNGKLIFSANDGVNGNEIWQYDGINPPIIIADINLGPSSSNPYEFFKFQNKLFFMAKDSNNINILFEYDGVNSPQIVTNVPPTAQGFYFLPYNGNVYFNGMDSLKGRELWKYDGINNSILLNDISFGSASSSPLLGIEFNNKLYFTADDWLHGREIWELYSCDTLVCCEAGFYYYIDTSGISDIIVVNTSIGNQLSYLWDFGDGNSSTTAYPQHNYSTQGPYNLCLTVDDGAGCNSQYCFLISGNGIFNKKAGFTINVIASPNVIGIDDILEKNSTLMIYPNPTSTQLTIDTKLAIKEVHLIDLTGKIIKTVAPKTNKINVSDLTNGIYFIKIISGEETIIQKFVKD